MLCCQGGVSGVKLTGPGGLLGRAPQPRHQRPSPRRRVNPPRPLPHPVRAPSPGAVLRRPCRSRRPHLRRQRRPLDPVQATNPLVDHDGGSAPTPVFPCGHPWDRRSASSTPNPSTSPPATSPASNTPGSRFLDGVACSLRKSAVELRDASRLGDQLIHDDVDHLEQGQGGSRGASRHMPRPRDRMPCAVRCGRVR